MISAICYLSCGCQATSSIPDTVPVSGVVKYEGETLSEGQVLFFPDGEEGKMGSGLIDRFGSYIVQTSLSAPGLRPGNYRIAIRSDALPASLDNDRRMTPAVSAIPEKYTNADQSGLTLVVAKDSKAITKNFELTGPLEEDTAAR